MLGCRYSFLFLVCSVFVKDFFHLSSRGILVCTFLITSLSDFDIRVMLASLNELGFFHLIYNLEDFVQSCYFFFFKLLIELAMKSLGTGIF